MKALVLKDDVDRRLALEELATPVPGPGQVLLAMRGAALNRRDYYISIGQYAGIRYDTIQGSDGCGIIHTAAAGMAPELSEGSRVIVNPSHGWGDDERVQSQHYTILGMQQPGTLAEFLAVDGDRIHPAPAHLSDTEAAALPLAGLTAYRAVKTQGQAAQGQRVLVTGIGGGVAQMAFQFAAALGAAVWVSSGTNWKIERARAMGAAGGVNYHEQDWAEQLKAAGGFDLIVDSAGGDQINTLLRLLKPGGSLVFFGSTLGRPSWLDTHRIFWNQLRLQGSTMGSDRDFAAMLHLVNAHKIVPVIDSVRPFAEVLDAYEVLKHNSQFGKLVVTF